MESPKHPRQVIQDFLAGRRVFLDGVDVTDACTFIGAYLSGRIHVNCLAHVSHPAGLLLGDISGWGISMMLNGKIELREMPSGYVCDLAITEKFLRERGAFIPASGHIPAYGDDQPNPELKRNVSASQMLMEHADHPKSPELSQGAY